MGASTQLSHLNEKISNKMNQETIFAHDEPRFFYFVREGFSNTQRTEGFSKTLDVTSEMLTGECIIDGWLTVPLNVGEVIMLSSAGDDRALSHMELDTTGMI